MKLRTLKIEDAVAMLEWMHDDSMVYYMKTNFAEKTLEDCKSFIQSAADTANDLHLAIVDENDVYMGTVSLKHIEDAAAEFAIMIRTCAMGLGYSSFGMKKIIEIGFEELKLSMIYWCVSPHNKRAVRFYDKNGYTRSQNPLNVEKHYSPEDINGYIWYSVYKNK